MFILVPTELASLNGIIIYSLRHSFFKTITLKFLRANALLTISSYLPATQFFPKSNHTLSLALIYVFASTTIDLHSYQHWDTTSCQLSICNLQFEILQSS